MMHSRPNRRHALLGLAVLASTPAVAQSVLDASELGVVADGGDQSAALQALLERAATEGRALRLPSGTIRFSTLELPGHLLIEGVAGRTVLQGGTVTVLGRSSLVLRDIDFNAAPLKIQGCDDVTLERCRFTGSDIAVDISDAAVTLRDGRFAQLADAAIHALDSRALLITGNRIEDCGNAGIRIWRSASGPDGTIIQNNHIRRIDWRSGGNGQNGNGVNVFQADDVIVAGNHISDCAFTAVRLNGTNNSQVAGNTCLRSGEVAIFSEFGFSGSVIANNIVDGAATGISITNLDTGGQLAVCSGNIVRNISPASAVNPDTIPIGIFAEAETAITGNSVHNVPGVALMAGYGPFLRNVLIDGNVAAECDLGIGVSVADGAGTVTIGSNMIDARQHDVVGLAWTEVVEPDLLANADRYPNVTV